MHTPTWKSAAGRTNYITQALIDREPENWENENRETQNLTATPIHTASLIDSFAQGLPSSGPYQYFLAAEPRVSQMSWKPGVGLLKDQLDPPRA